MLMQLLLAKSVSVLDSDCDTCYFLMEKSYKLRRTLINNVIGACNEDSGYCA